MLEEANTKRRKLEREKRKMDRPKDGELLGAYPSPTSMLTRLVRRRSHTPARPSSTAGNPAAPSSPARL